MERQPFQLEKAPSFTKETHPNITTIAQAAAAAAQHRSKAEKEIEKLDKDREQKNKEREKEIEKEIDKIERDRDKSVEKASQDHQPSATSNLLHLLPSLKEKDLFVDSQKARLRELFSQIEKEFELLWEENQDLRRKLEDSYSKQPSSAQSSNSQHPQRKDSGLGSRLNPLKKKEGKTESSEWERLTHFIGHRDGIWEVSPCNWEKNSNSFATASVDRTARVWTSDASRPVYIYVGHKGSVNSVRFHPTSRLVVTASGDNTAHIWRLPKPEEKKDKPKEFERDRERDSNLKPWTPVLEKDEVPGSGAPLSQSPNVVDSSVVPNPALNVTASSIEPTDDGVSTFGVVTISRAALELKHKNVVSAADWLYPGDKVVTGSWDGMVRLWSAENGRCIHEIGPTSSSQSSVPITQQYDSFFVTNVTVHKASSIAVASYSDGSFRLFDFRTEKPTTSVTNAHSELVASACFGVDDNLLLSGSDDRTVKIWDRRNMKVPKTIIRCHASLNRFSVSPINSYLAIPMDDMATKVCDLNGKYVLGRIKSEGKNGHKAMVTCAAWSIDESVVFTAGFDRTVIAWGRPSDKPRSERSKLASS